MPENIDQPIKLFGKKIPLTAECGTEPLRLDDSTPRTLNPMDIQEKESQRDEEGERAVKESTLRKADTAIDQKDDPSENSDDTNNSEATSNPKTNGLTTEEQSSKTEKEHNDAVNSQEKPLKKPDKILPCPRCNSMDTKFCYYNNYNVNQPRHFCKACQRYWTAGGTMRNVPVGAGRRKNKYPASHYHHITISEALQAATVDAKNGTHLPALKNNGRVLSFGLDAPICDSMASLLNLTDKKVLNGTRNGFCSIGELSIPVHHEVKENGNDCSSTSSTTISVEEVSKRQSLQSSSPASNGFHAQIPCLPGVPWPYPWNSAAPPPAFYPAGFPLSFYPAPFWNCSVPSNWGIPWSSPQLSSPSQKSPISGPNSPTLGKHSRDGDVLKSHNSDQEESLKQKNGYVLVPKTLRIDDPSGAAKSSIWATLGIKNEAVHEGGMFKAFQIKNDEKHHVIEASPVLRANPAALSRYVNFHENS